MKEMTISNDCLSHGNAGYGFGDLNHATVVNHATACCQCGKIVLTPDNTWDSLPAGWGCLYGSLACCSKECAEEFAKTSSYGVLRPGDFEVDH